jgi:YidC/Oxa1 family membrane protein insertase
MATLLCLLILVGWLKVQEIFYPPPPVTPTSPSPAEGPPSVLAPDRGGSQSPTVQAAPPTDGPGTDEAELQAAEFHVSDALAAEKIQLGDSRGNDPATGFFNPFELAVGLTPRGGGVEWVKLSRHRNTVKDGDNPEHDPYDLLGPIEDPRTGRRYTSFVTEQIRFKTSKQEAYEVVDLTDAVWTLEASPDDQADAATARTVVRKGNTDILAVEKTYRLAKGDPHLGISLSVRNLGDQPCDIILTQRGPVGMKKEDYRYEYRKIVVAAVDDQGLTSLGPVKSRDDIFKADVAGRKLLPGDGQHTLWTGLGNKYFACIIAPLPLEDWTPASGPKHPQYLARVSGEVFLDDPEAEDDLTFDLIFHPSAPLEPGQHLTMNLQVFCGPKSEALFESLPEGVQERNYHLIRSADSRWCTFEIITTIMLWLLTKAYVLVGNYGIAIIILVLVVRLILHPVTKRGQINMMKMQKGMAQLKPKLEVIQQQYKNDKQKLQEEQMKLYREEGINPAGQIFGCLPMFLQMPVWIALWTTLNTNVDMRHLPFFWWINDLTAPDALFSFGREYDIPLIGAMMGPISAFNLLPIIMTVTMYAQQKLTQKLTKPVTPAAPKTDKDGKPLPDQMAQQQKIMSFMMIFFGFIFYNFPSGLNLYILSSNVFGMIEQYFIKKHIREKEQSGEFDRTKKAASSAKGKPSFIARHFEQLQKKVEQTRQTQSGRSGGKALGKRKKQRS